MKIKVLVKPNSSQQKIVKVGDNEYYIWLNEKPVENKANLELVKLFKKEFNKPVKIKSGFNSRRKIIEILGQIPSEAIKRSCPSKFRGKSARKTRGVLA